MIVSLLETLELVFHTIQIVTPKVEVYILSNLPAIENKPVEGLYVEF